MTAVGISHRIDAAGDRWPWLVVLEQAGERFQCLIALPEDKRFITPPVHPAYGSLTRGASVEQIREALAARAVGDIIWTHEENRGSPIIEGLEVRYYTGRLREHGEAAFAQLSVMPQQEKIRETHS